MDSACMSSTGATPPLLLRPAADTPTGALEHRTIHCLSKFIFVFVILCFYLIFQPVSDTALFGFSATSLGGQMGALVSSEAHEVPTWRRMPRACNPGNVWLQCYFCTIDTSLATLCGPPTFKVHQTGVQLLTAACTICQPPSSPFIIVQFLTTGLLLLSRNYLGVTHLNSAVTLTM